MHGQNHITFTSNVVDVYALQFVLQEPLLSVSIYRLIAVEDS